MLNWALDSNVLISILEFPCFLIFFQDSMYFSASVEMTGIENNMKEFVRGCDDGQGCLEGRTVFGSLGIVTSYCNFCIAYQHSIIF